MALQEIVVGAVAGVIVAVAMLAADKADPAVAEIVKVLEGLGGAGVAVGANHIEGAEVCGQSQNHDRRAVGQQLALG